MTKWNWDPMNPSDPPTASEKGEHCPVPSPFPTFPLLWHPVRTRIDADRAPHGRIVGVEYTYDYQPSEKSFQSALGKNDIVWVPLFEGTINNPANSFSQRRQEFDKNLQAISDFGPNVKAILCGNANAEIRFANCSPAEEYEKCLVFTEKLCQFLDHHAKPAFAPIFEILIYDCYSGNGALRELLTQHDAQILSFAGCSWLFEHQGDHPNIPEPKPYPALQTYIASLNAMSGVGRLHGLRDGSGETLKAMGFKAGFAGWY